MRRAPICVALLACALPLGASCRDVDVVTDGEDGTTSGATTLSSSAATSGASTSSSSSSGTSPCGAGECSYAAMSLVTGAPRLAVLKADKLRDLCFQIVLVAAPGEQVVFSSAKDVEMARVTSSASDCLPWGAGFPPDPVGDVVDATDLVGSLSVSSPPCSVTIAAKKSFDGAPSWVPGEETLDASDILMENGCP